MLQLLIKTSLLYSSDLFYAYNTDFKQAIKKICAYRYYSAFTLVRKSLDIVEQHVS